MWYTDDIVLIAWDEIQLQEMIDITAAESHDKGLSLNSWKTDVLTIAKKQCVLKCSIKINWIGSKVKASQRFRIYMSTFKTAYLRRI